MMQASRQCCCLQLKQAVYNYIVLMQASLMATIADFLGHISGRKLHQQCGKLRDLPHWSLLQGRRILEDCSLRESAILIQHSHVIPMPVTGTASVAQQSAPKPVLVASCVAVISDVLHALTSESVCQGGKIHLCMGFAESFQCLPLSFTHVIHGHNTNLLNVHA